MVNAKNAIFNWSGGKDSSLCLYQVLKETKYLVRYLVTTLNGQNNRVSMHGVHENLLGQQAKAIGIPLKKVYLLESPDMETYNKIFTDFLNQMKNENINTSIFGDIFLEDLRKYREEQLAKIGFTAAFPLWGRKTSLVANDFIQKGFKAIIVSVDSRYLDKSFAGRIYDESFLNDLPANVDPCGENGEFHSFVFDGPIFKTPVIFEKGEIVYKEYKSHSKENPDENIGFWYCDLK